MNIARLLALGGYQVVEAFLQFPLVLRGQRIGQLENPLEHDFQIVSCGVIFWPQADRVAKPVRGGVQVLECLFRFRFN